MKKIKQIVKDWNSFRASVCGFLTSLLMILVLIDWSTFDWKNVNHLMKLAIALLPWLGGYKSEFKTPENVNINEQT